VDIFAREYAPEENSTVLPYKMAAVRYNVVLKLVGTTS
jgi:hypothetical protein